MPNVHLKGVPLKLHTKLKKSARENRRSLNSEAIFRLAQAYGMPTSVLEMKTEKRPPKQ